MSDEQDISVINKRLKEINKEFRDLSTLKKKLVTATASSNFKEKYGNYSILVKPNENKALDFETMVIENDLKIKPSIYGLLCASYKVGEQQVGYHLARTEEEANQIRVVQNLFKIGDDISAKVKEGKTLTAEEILTSYDEARNEQIILESKDTEEVS